MPIQTEKPGHADLTGGSQTTLHNHPPKNNFAAVVAPTANDDSGQGYAIGSHWIDVQADNPYICVDASAGAAVWKAGAGASWPTRGEGGVLEETVPRNAFSTSVAVGKNWVFGSYTQMVASLPANFTVVGVQCFFVGSISAAATYLTHLEVEIATGAAGAETVFDSFNLAAVFQSSLNAGLVGYPTTVPVGKKLVASGTRIAARARTNVGDGIGLEFYMYLVGYYGTPTASVATYDFGPYHVGTYAPGQRFVTPSGSLLAVPSGSRTTPSYGAWTQVLASAPADLLIGGVAYSLDTVAKQDAFVQFGTGSAGLEVARVMIPVASRLALNATMAQAIRPLLVLSGERVAMRIAAGTLALNCQVMYETL